MGLKQLFVHSKSALQSAIIQVMKKSVIATLFQEKDLILKRYFRLPFQKVRNDLFCLHSYNSPEEISEVLVLLSKFSFNRLVLYSFSKKNYRKPLFY
jgi:8-amino-7-oxononanoate synthase